MFKHIPLFLLTFFLFLPLINACTCELSYHDQMDVKVFDAHWRPLENAVVQVTYQRDRSFGSGYSTTAPLLTDEHGLVHVNMWNQEVDPSLLRCDVTVDVYYQGLHTSRDYVAQCHSSEVQFQLPVHRLYLTLKDTDGRLLSNITVYVNDMEKNTDSAGRVYFDLPEGTANITYIYNGAAITHQVEIKNDTNVALTARLYDLNLKIADENGKPIQATIRVENDEYTASELHLNNLTLSSPRITIEYNGLVRELPVSLSDTSDYSVVFDMSAPKMSNVKLEKTDDNSYRISFNLIDEGSYASGIDLASTSAVVVRNSGSPKTKSIYVSSGKYYLDLGKMKAGDVVDVSIVLYDKDGNKRTNELSFVIPTEENSGNASASQGSEENLTKEEGNIIYLIVGIIVLAIIVYVIYNYFRSYDDEEGD